MENWKPIAGYEGVYEVSDYGRVRRVEGLVRTGIKHNELKTVKSKVLKQNKKRNGYLTVDLSKEHKVKTISVHRLVAIAFVEQEEGKTVVNHKNCNKTDNRAVNLEWCTAKENREHAKTNNLYYNPNTKKIKCKQTGVVFEGSYKAAEWVNETRYKNSKQVVNIASKIRAACKGIQSTAHGYTWCYVEGSSTIL